MSSRAFAAAASLVLAGVTGAVAASCNSEKVPSLRGEALLDPKNCQSCHPSHFREWSGSMHAYAGEDPVFVAMNKRMQRETNGAAGDFCVKCHAPMALRLGQTKDGLNLAELAPHLRGVTCVFCHTIAAVTGTHNAAVSLEPDVLRGGIAAPHDTMPHGGVYSTLHDRESLESSAACGACHDVVTPLGAPLERTFVEWKASVYAKVDPKSQLSCGKCHMEGRSDVAATTQGAPPRRVHDHSMAAVDIAITPFPEADDQRRRVQKLLDGTLIAKLCVRRDASGFTADVTLDNAFAGHAFPSGASHDRRVWVELVATRAGAPVFSSGVVGDDQAVVALSDPNLWLLRDRVFDGAGREVKMFWEVARVEPGQLPGAVTNDPRDPSFFHAVTKSYPIAGAEPDRVAMRVRLRPIDRDVLDDLVKSGDLDPALGAKVTTFDLASTVKEWRDGDGPCAK